MTFWNHTTIGGERFAGPFADGFWLSPTLPHPPDATVSHTNVGAGQEGIGIYPGDEANVQPPDRYYKAADPAITLALVGAAYSAGTIVRRTYNWETLTNDEIAAVKLAELEDHVSFIARQSTVLSESPNFWIDLGETGRRRFASANATLQDRVKDRTLGDDSTDPGSIKPAASYWPNRDPVVLLIRNSNGNRMLVPTGEVSWGGVQKDIAKYDDDIMQAEYAVTQDIDDALATGVRANIVAIEPTAAAYGWPAYYTGVTSLVIMAVPRRRMNGGRLSRLATLFP